MATTQIKNLVDHIGSEVTIGGWVDVRRDHGKLIFMDIRDGAGYVQTVVLPEHTEALAVATTLRSEDVVLVTGKVNARPERMVKEGQNGNLELEVLSIEVLSKAQELPFTLDADINLDTLLDFRPLTLRSKRERAIFKVQAEIIRAYRDFLISEGFTEFQSPKLVGGDAEGGAGVFKVEYFKSHDAYLATSPQFYKQMMVGVYQKVFTVGNVYRAEKHSTSRHINEYTSLDLEMGFIKDHTDIMALETRLLRFIIEHLGKTVAEEFKTLGAELPVAPETFPSFKLREAQALIKQETGEDCTNEPDLEPQHERWLSAYAKEHHGSDFVFVTHYPVSKRPMYTYEDENDLGFTKSFDLLFRGIEITTGGQRVHNYDLLVEKIKGKGLDPENFSFYLQSFKYGMPPHGGLGMGLERLTAKMLGLDNVKEATLFPRDLNRIDTLLSKNNDGSEGSNETSASDNDVTPA
jgi:nondiscriminating aspartyl-tRNA synthetase